MAVNSSGLSVKGQITATSGYIGSESSGFNIGSTAIYNGMTSMSDTTHNGIYLGTDGIALGQGKFKVTKNGKWYLVYYLTNEKASKYEAGDTVTVDFSGTPVDVTVSRVQTGQKYSKITLSCKSFFDGFLEVRNIDTTVTVASAEGLILQDDSIIETPEGQRGVFVKNKLGEHIFKPVRVKADDGTRCVAYSDIYVDDGGNYVETIGTYDEIVSEPTEEDMASLIKPQQEVQQDVSQ
jgi:hypothetical protein